MAPYHLFCYVLFKSLSQLCIILSLQAITARDSMAKSLYSALFDWIVLRINHALLNKKDMEESVPVRDKHSHTHNSRITVKKKDRRTLYIVKCYK